MFLFFGPPAGGKEPVSGPLAVSGKFDPDRFKNIPDSHQVDEAKCEHMGLSRSPSAPTAFKGRAARTAAIHNSGFGTVYPIVDGKPLPVCDYAGFAPFG